MSSMRKQFFERRIRQKAAMSHTRPKDGLMELAVVLPGLVVPQGNAKKWGKTKKSSSLLTTTSHEQRMLAIRKNSVQISGEFQFEEWRVSARALDQIFSQAISDELEEGAPQTQLQVDDTWAKSPYTLTSFEGRSEAELIRLMLVVARVKFVDTRVTEEEWDNMKYNDEEWRNRSLPILSRGGRMFSGASAIVRTLANIYSLMGCTNHDHLIVEATYERLLRLQCDHSEAIKWVIHPKKESDSDKQTLDWAQSQLTHVVLPSAFKEWEALILNSPGPFIISNGMTLADVAIMDFVDQISSNLIISPILADFPAVSDLLSLVQTLPTIHGYLDDRAKESGEFVADQQKPSITIVA